MDNIGLCGAHRTGKTTLAIAVSKELRIPFVEIGTSKLFSDRNLDPAKPMDFRTRLYIQRVILDHAEDIWGEMYERFVCDRTPIDMAAYTLAEVQGKTLDEGLEGELADYLSDCQEVTERCFSHLFLVPPAILIVDEAGKASPSRGYIEHIHRLCVGFFHGSDALQTGCRLARSLTDLHERVKFVTDFVAVMDK